MSVAIQLARPAAATPSACEENLCLEYARATATKLLERIEAIDFKSYEPLLPEPAVVLLVKGAAGQLDRTLSETMRLLASLPSLLLGKTPPGPEPVDDQDLDLDEELSEIGAVEGAPPPPEEQLDQQVDSALARLTAPSVGGVPLDLVSVSTIWSSLEMEARKARARLREARGQRSKWGLISEGEHGRWMARKALRYGLQLAECVAAQDAGHMAPEEDLDELNLALRVRRTLMTFRRDMLSITEDTGILPNVTLTACLHTVRLRLLELFLSKGYEDIRAMDRFQLQGLRQQVSRWLDGPQDDSPAARAILANVRTFAELLVLVNHREILIQHDRKVRAQGMDDLRDLLATLAVSKRYGWRRYAEILEQLREMEWRNGQLDGLLQSELKQPAIGPDGLVTRVQRVHQRLREVSI